MLRSTMFIAVGLLFAVAPIQSAYAQQFGNRGEGGRPGGQMPSTQISGSVVDAETGESIPSASVAVWSVRDSSLTTGAISDSEGAFLIEGLRPGRYYVQVHFVGYLTEVISDIALRPGAWTADLGIIELKTDVEMLDEVIVEERREFMEVGIDRTVYNTRDQLVSAGGDASQVLEEIPSVEVDIDGNISLRGNQNVAILLNGRPTSMTGEALITFLQGLPATSVDRVEVIPNPSAKYEPDGMSGILNIVLRKDQDLGFGGSLTAGGGTQESYNAGGSLNFIQGKFSSFVNYGFRHGVRNSTGDRWQENRVADPLFVIDEDDRGERGGDSHNFSTSIDYNMSDKNVLSLATRLSVRGGDQDGLNVYRILDANQVEMNSYDRTRLGDRTDLNQDYRLTFSRIVAPGTHELQAEVRYEKEKEEDENSYALDGLRLGEVVPGVGTDSFQQRSTQEENTGEGSLQLDYTRPLGNGKLEAGYRGSIDLLDSRFGVETFDYDLNTYLTDVRRTNTFDYRQNIQAAYGIVQQEFGPIAAQVGLRYEQARTTFDLTTADERYENDYNSLFPSAFLTWELSRSETSWKQLKFSYSKRISRPSTWRLNPFNDNLDPYSRREGNPYLEPEYTHAVEGSYIHFAGSVSITLTPYYRQTNNRIQWYEFINDRGVSITTFRNFDSSSSWGFESIGTLRLTDRLNAFGSFNAFRMQTDGSNVESGLGNDAWGWSTRANATLSVREGLSVQLSWFYRAPMDIENGRIGAFSRVSIGARQQLLNERATLSLQIRDPFDMMQFNITRDTPRFYQESVRSFNARQANLSLTYNFGRQRQQRRRGNYERGDGMDQEVQQEVQM
ncbi:MAG: TonB-dependent receptor [Bacteroidetes bacterium SB0662_bin_6]|nr:TonB-dependent receptor [Bacteroidetes bacterium SB0668_bin_1]MYE03872.1 TonB-dependent receptor [Bacteroidetes bacterium SB0662_bin_6]